MPPTMFKWNKRIFSLFAKKFLLIYFYNNHTYWIRGILHWFVFPWRLMMLRIFFSYAHWLCVSVGVCQSCCLLLYGTVSGTCCHQVVFSFLLYSYISIFVIIVGFDFLNSLYISISIHLTDIELVSFVVILMFFIK